MNTREISLAALMAALYAALVVVLAPVSFGPVQLRVADCIIPLSAVLGWPAVVGVSLGAFIGNAYFFLGPVDVILGSVANLLAAFIIFRLRNRLLHACITGSFAIGLIVGGYLWIYFPPPYIGVMVPAWMAMIVSITLSSLVAIAIVGYLLVNALLVAGLSKTLRSMGLKTHL